MQYTLSEVEVFCATVRARKDREGVQAMLFHRLAAHGEKEDIDKVIKGLP